MTERNRKLNISEKMQKMMRGKINEFCRNDSAGGAVSARKRL